MRRLVLAILLLMAAQPCFAVVEIGDALNTVTLAVETPHVKWAKPLAGGPLKALVIGPRFGMRDLAELGQRLDLTWTVVMAGNSKSWEGSARVKGCTEADALRALDRAVKDDYDLILIGNVHWGILPKPALYEVFKKVRDGAGLVYVPFEKTPPLLGELFEPAPAASSPQWIVDGAAIAGIECMKGLAGPVEFAGVLGRGRVVILRWPGGPGGIHFLTPGRAATYVDYEYCQQALARACLWACRRTPEKALTVALPETVEMVRASQVKLAAPPGSWRMAIRDAEGELEWEREGQSGEIPWPPALKLGAHFCDLWALRDAKVADFASRCFTVAGGVSVGEITFDKPFVEVGEQVQGTVKLAGEGQRPAQAEVSLFDIFKQEITRQRLKLPPGATSFTFAFSPVVSVATKHRVRVRLLDESDAAYAEKWADLLVPTRGYADMQVIGWAIGSGSWLTDLLAWQGRRRGFTASIFSGNLNAGIRGVPYTTSYRYTGLSRVESPCYTNPEDRRKEAEKLRDRARTHLPQGILAYSLGDENTLAVSHVDVCMSPTCQEDFREYLRRVYGTLAALNAEWGTAYKAWSEVAPMTEKEAQERGNLAPFIDHRLHMDDVFAGIHLFAQDVLHEIDPKTPVGPEGLWSTGALRGFHWTKFARNLGVVNVYTDEYLKREIIRSLAPRQALHGMWYGGYEHDVDAPERMARLPWMMLLHDQNSVWWYSVRSYSHIGSCLGAFAPDLRPMPYFERTLAEWDTLHRGAAKLIMSLPRLHDGLAVLYSRPSAYAFGLGTEDLLAALEDAGYQYDIVSDEDLAQAPPDPRKYRALILPNCRALSEAEARHVEAFAVAGGLVIADLLPGLYDEHAKLRPSGRLNDLFGVASMNATVRQEETSAVFEAMTIPLLATGECAVAAGSPRAKLADGRPAIITREHDKGRAVYLNFSLEGYRHERQKESLPTLARLLQQLLVGHGVMPPVQVSDAHGQPVPRCEVCRYGDERMQLVGILREVGKGPEVVTATIKLPVKGHVYDVRRRKYLGQSDSLDVPLGPVEVFAALPYRVTGIPPRRISGPQNARPGAAVALQAQVRADGPTVGTHVLRFESISPTGGIAPVAENVVAERGQALWTWRIPHNAQAGRWRVRITDAATGETAEWPVAVK